jgi:hypothetical protein
MTVNCGQCGEPIIDESPGGDPTARKPCPKCGSRTRKFGVQQHFTAAGTVTVDATVITYPQNLLALARMLIDEGRYGISVVVAHMACEVAAERSLTEAFLNRGIPDLEDPVTDLLNGYNLAREQNRKLYTALTGDDIQKKRFWQKFKESASRRNKIIHNSAIVGKIEAEDSFNAASGIVAHLKK